MVGVNRIRLGAPYGEGTAMKPPRRTQKRFLLACLVLILGQTVTAKALRHGSVHQIENRSKYHGVEGGVERVSLVQEAT